MGCFHHRDDLMCSLFLSPDNLNNEFSKGGLQPILNAGCKKPLFEVAYRNIALQLNIFLRALQIKINVEKERMIQVKNITWKLKQGMWTEVYLVYYPPWQHWAPAAFTNSRAPSQPHGEIICPGALACISNTVTDWFQSQNKMFSVFPIVFINNDKPIELTAAVQFYWENVTVVNLPNSGWHFLLSGSLGEESPGALGIEEITSECCPVQIAVENKVKLQSSPGKLISPNCISWQETQILEVPVEIIQYLNSD